MRVPFDPPISNISLDSVSNYQLFQRDGIDQADIPISGSFTGSPASIEASYDGGAFTTIDASPSAGAFSGTLSNQAAGQGPLIVRFTDDTDILDTAYHVGIGDIYIIAGQSNASGRGDNNQVYSHGSLKATLFGNDYTWKELSDPSDDNTDQVDTVSSDGSGGSYWLPLATSIMADQSVPVAFVPCAKGGTSITEWQAGADHSDRTTLYGSMNYRIAQIGDVKAVLWHQGERDADDGMPEATYNTYLDALANDIQADQGIKLMACKIQDVSDRNETNVNNAIGTAWGDNANVLEGPDFSSFTPDGDVHFTSDADMAQAAGDWWTAIDAEFYT